MLVLNRRVGETICVGDSMTITILAARAAGKRRERRARLGIAAPKGERSTWPGGSGEIRTEELVGLNLVATIQRACRFAWRAALVVVCWSAAY